MIQRVGTELHWARNDGFGGNGVEHRFVLENDESGHISDNFALLKLLQIQDLNVGHPHGFDEVGATHHRAVIFPFGSSFIDQ